MVQNEATADLGVPGNDPAITDLDWGVFPMSSTFDADLARANLMRVRADYRKAEEICLQILQTYPNSAATHTLLGDICNDRGMLEQAAHWYELSLDLDPNSLADQQKLDDVRQQIQERDHINSALALGIPDQKAARSIWMAVIAGCILFLAIGLGFTVKYGNIGGKKDQAVVKTPIEATVDNVVPNATSGYVATRTIGIPIPAGTSVSADSSAPPMTMSSSDDKDLELNVQNNSEFGDHMIGLVIDPRTKVALVTYLCGPKDDERRIGADLAKTIFQLTEEPVSITLRGMRFQKLLYMADVTRERFEETLTDEWQKNNPGQDAWIAYILTNEWPAKPGTTSNTPADAPKGDAPKADASTSPASAPSDTKGTTPPAGNSSGGN